MKARSIHNVILDLGGVLLHWNPDAIAARLYDDGELRAAVKQEVFQHPNWLELDRGTLKEEDAVRLFHQRTGRPVREMRALMRLVRESLTPIPESMDLMDELLARGFDLYCLSNMHAESFAYLRQRYTFWDKFKGIVISAQVRMIKPELGIYQRLLSEYQLAPAACVVVDDHLPNVEAARQVGLRAILFRGAADCRKQLCQMLAR